MPSSGEPGKQFEKDVLNSVRFSSCYILRLKDCPGTWNQEHTKLTQFTSSNECDFIVFVAGRLFLLELKSVGGTSLPFNRIRPAQRKGLSEAHVYNRVYSGVLLNFRKKDRTFWIPAQKIFSLEKLSGRSSVSVKDAENIGVEIHGEKKRTRWRYDIVGGLMKTRKVYPCCICYAPSTSLVDITETQSVGLCKSHEEAEDEDILKACQHDSKEYCTCGKPGTSLTPFLGKYKNLCQECSRRLAITELKGYMP